MVIPPPVHMNCKGNSLIINYIYDLSGFSSFISSSRYISFAYKPKFDRFDSVIALRSVTLF